MDGVGGKAGWAWIFILEGLATMLVAACCPFMISNWPESARFLDAGDRIRMQRRLAAGQQKSTTSENFDKRHIYAALMDWKTWCFALIYIGASIPLLGFSLFLPTIPRGMG